jgi:glycerol-3-phosphate dehydrogenase
MTAQQDSPVSDLLILGGGLAACAIARDGAARGLRVMLAAPGDLASDMAGPVLHDSLGAGPALREQHAFLRTAPHISTVLRVVRPLVTRRAGLGVVLRDRFARAKSLAPSRLIPLRGTPEGAVLAEDFPFALDRPAVVTDASRLAVLTARDAATRGAEVLVQTRVMFARVAAGLWEVGLERGGRAWTQRARVLVRQAGPVGAVHDCHIVTHRLFAHDKAYAFADGLFALPYEQDFTLIGMALPADASGLAVRDALVAAANRHFAPGIGAADVLRVGRGVQAGAVQVKTETGAPMLTVVQGDVAARVVDGLAGIFPGLPRSGVGEATLPDGDFAPDSVVAAIAALRRDYPFLTAFWAARLFRAYGTETGLVLGVAGSIDDLGVDFGATLTAREVAWAMVKEFARTAEDVIWRRSKLGLRLDGGQVAALEAWMRDARAGLDQN